MGLLIVALFCITAMYLPSIYISTIFVSPEVFLVPYFSVLLDPYLGKHPVYLMLLLQGIYSVY